jgi:hypothetical protein
MFNRQNWNTDLVMPYYYVMEDFGTLISYGVK